MSQGEQVVSGFWAVSRLPGLVVLGSLSTLVLGDTVYSQGELLVLLLTVTQVAFWALSPQLLVLTSQPLRGGWGSSFSFLRCQDGVSKHRPRCDLWRR